MSHQIDYCKLLIDWRTQQQQQVRQRFPSDKPLHDFTPHYHADIANRNTLLLTLGDSWTWGTSLEKPFRLQQVYGALVSKELNADWINVGCQGWSNSFILEHIDFLLNLLENNNYKKIYIVITLTENARDVATFPHFRFDYQRLCDEIGLGALYYNTLLQECEKFWIKQINQAIDRMDERYHVVIGQNFVWHPNVVDQLKDRVQLLDLNWIECLADRQQLPRPIRTNLVTGWIVDQFDKTVHEVLKLKLKDRTEFKQWALPYINRATLVNEWLDGSSMNHKIASKHPTQEGQMVWADYILKNLS